MNSELGTALGQVAVSGRQVAAQEARAPGETPAGMSFGGRGFIAAALVGFAFAHPLHGGLRPATLPEPARPDAPAVVSASMAPWPIGLSRIVRSPAPEAPRAPARDNGAREHAALTPFAASGPRNARSRSDLARSDAAPASAPDAAPPTRIGPAARAAEPEAPTRGAVAGATEISAPASASFMSRDVVPQNAARPRAAPVAAPAPAARAAPVAPSPGSPGFFEDPVAYIARLGARDRPTATDLDARHD